MKDEHSEKPKWQLHLEEILRGYKMYNCEERNINIGKWLKTWSNALCKNNDWFSDLGTYNPNESVNEEINKAKAEGWLFLCIHYKNHPDSPFTLFIRCALDDLGMPTLQIYHTESFGVEDGKTLKWSARWSNIDVISEENPIFEEGFVLTQINLCFETYMRWANKMD